MEIPYPQILTAMVRYNSGDPKRIQHALKVYAFASLIGERENLGAQTFGILKTAAILHDIGIHNSEKKYHSAAGNYQELEGPPVARELLEPYGLPAAFTDRVCFLVGHHHSYDKIDGPDYQILVESDLLVNLYEDGLSREQANAVLKKYFRTGSGSEILTEMYGTVLTGR